MIADILKARPEIKPNLVIDIYKNRRGKMSSLKIFRYFDFGTCRATDLFVTDANYRKYEPEDGKIGVVEFETRTYDTLDRLTEGEKNNG